jgi:hypothetical protein
MSAQYLNKHDKTFDAVAIVDISHLFHMMGQAQLDDELELEGYKAFYRSCNDILLGACDGNARGISSWVQFFKKAAHEPGQTVDDLAKNCQQIGQTLSAIGTTLNEFSPFMYALDSQLDMQDRGLILPGPIYESKIKRKLRLEIPVSPEQPSRVQARFEKNKESVKNGAILTLQIGHAVVENMLQKTLRENVADVYEGQLNAKVTQEITKALFTLCKIAGKSALDAAKDINDNLPPIIKDSPYHLVDTGMGQISIIADSTGENVIDLIAHAVGQLPIQSTADLIAQGKALYDDVQKNLPPREKEIAELHKSLEPYLNCNKVLHPEKLKEIAKDIPQVNEFQKVTKDFTDFSQLNQDEILYLNLCEWLEPKAKDINQRLLAKGGITLIDSATGNKALLTKYDVFHSLLGEMKPGSISKHTKGGHLFIAELKAVALELEQFKELEHGFFDMLIKRGSNKKFNTFYPLGTSPEQAINYLEEAILYPQAITLKSENDKIKCILTHPNKQQFTLYIDKNNIAQFHPAV